MSTHGRVEREAKNKDILRLQVPVDNSIFVEVRESVCDL